MGGCVLLPHPNPGSHTTALGSPLCLCVESPVVSKAAKVPAALGLTF